MFFIQIIHREYFNYNFILINCKELFYYLQHFYCFLFYSIIQYCLLCTLSLLDHDLYLCNAPILMLKAMCYCYEAVYNHIFAAHLISDYWLSGIISYIYAL